MLALHLQTLTKEHLPTGQDSPSSSSPSPSSPCNPGQLTSIFNSPSSSSPHVPHLLLLCSPRGLITFRGLPLFILLTPNLQRPPLLHSVDSSPLEDSPFVIQRTSHHYEYTYLPSEEPLPLEDFLPHLHSSAILPSTCTLYCT